MYETFAALLLAHVLADFAFQPAAMVRAKHRWWVMLLHAAVVLVLSLAAVGQWNAPPVFALAAAHLVIDAVKRRFGDTLGPFLLDQAAHLATLVLVAGLAPNLWEDGLWATLAPPATGGALPALMLYLAGAVVAVRAGEFVTAKLLAPFTPFWTRAAILSGGLRDGGRMIGLLERGLTYLLVLAGHPAGVAFLIAAKTILRFNASEDRKLAEYVIIGTLASVGWALATAFATEALVALADTPLETPPGTP